MCKECEKNPVYEFTNKRKLCKICFIKYFQKKFLYVIRKFEMIKKGDVISYKKKNDFRSVVLEVLLKMFSEKAFVNLVKMPNKKVNKIAISSTIDSEADKITQDIIKGDANLKKVSPSEGKFIKPLYLFLDKEVLLYARLKGLKFKEIKENKNNISKFIDELEKKHPEIKRAIVNSYLKLN